MPREVNVRSRLISLMAEFAKNPDHNPEACQMMSYIELLVSSDAEINFAFEAFIDRAGQDTPVCDRNKDFCLCSLMHVFALGVWCGVSLIKVDYAQLTEKVQ